MASIIVSVLFLAIPFSALVWAIVSTVLFVKTNRRRHLDPLSVTDTMWRTRRILMIASLVTFGVLSLCITAIVLLFFMAIAYM